MKTRSQLRAENRRVIETAFRTGGMIAVQDVLNRIVRRPVRCPQCRGKVNRVVPDKGWFIFCPTCATSRFRQALDQGLAHTFEHENGPTRASTTIGEPGALLSPGVLYPRAIPHDVAQGLRAASIAACPRRTKRPKKPSVTCPVCRHPEVRLKQHVGSWACKVDAVATDLVHAGFVPYPSGHSLPMSILGGVCQQKQTRWPVSLGNTFSSNTFSPFNHAPSWPKHRTLDAQTWAPLWVRIVTEGWDDARTQAGKGNHDRDLLLAAVLRDPEVQAMLESTWRMGGTRASNKVLAQLWRDRVVEMAGGS